MEAWHSLLPAAQKFAKNPTIAYNLACYACQLGRLGEARHWFQRAVELGDAQKVRSLGQQDPDLKPLYAANLV